MNYTDLIEVDLSKLGVAVTDWKQATDRLQTLVGDARDGLKAKSDKAHWAGLNADVTREFVDKTTKEFSDLHAEAKSIWSVIEDAHSELESLQNRAKRLTEAARKEEFISSSTRRTARSR
ncbi:hypothetical protein [Streptomyces antnestii]|uniref:hypothetical protein n=1 Tax=Streptomyces antnestii TaxID=2494256 RepID=UPI001CB98330|nr:hypothetical protein [Streptomyces sp. San01]